MRYILAFLLGFALMGIATNVKAAELPIPHPPHPSALPPERCLKAGENPSPGQTLHTDLTCPTKLRWIFAR
jgi:hypothetical protein